MILPSLWKRGAVWLTAFAALGTTGARTANAASSSLVISQVYGGGGNASAPFKNDFIEVYNRGAAAVNVTGWTVQYASTAGTFNANTALPSVSVQPGQYLLIQEASGGAVGAAIPVTPDATGAINLSATNGKVALASDSSIVTGPTAANVVDYVGYGTASAYEGTAAAPAGTNTTAILRAGVPRGATDTDDNKADFTTGAPDPRNSAYGQANTPPTVTGAAFTPASVDPGASSTLSATVAAGSSSPTISSVTAVLPAALGGATVTLTNGGSGTTYSATVPVPANAAPGQYAITITATDANTKSGTGTATLTVNDVAPAITVLAARALGASSNIVKVHGYATTALGITGTLQAYISDLNGAAGIQVYEGSLTPSVPIAVGDEVTVTGTIQIFRGYLELVATQITKGTTGNTVAPAVTTIPVAETINASGDQHPNGGRLITLNNLTVSSQPTAAPFVAQDAAGNTINVFFSTASGVTAASLAPGVYNFTGINVYFGATTNETGTDPTKFEIVLRSAADAVFLGASLITGSSATPAFVPVGTSTTLSVTTVAGATVTGTLPAALGGGAVTFTGDGSGNYTYTVNVGANVAPDVYSVPVHVVSGSQTGDTIINVNVYTPGLTIAQIRALPDGTPVQITGNVSSYSSGTAHTYYIQDATAGVYLFNTTTATNDPTANEGDSITSFGVKSTFSGGVQVSYANTPTPTVSAGSTVNPVTVTLAQSPANYGKLVTINNLVVTTTAAAGTNQVLYVTDGTGTGEVFISAAALGNGFPSPLTYAVGDVLSVTGPVDAFTTTIGTVFTEIKPRRQSDVVNTGAAPAQTPTQITVTAQPAGGTPGGAITPAITVAIKDASGNVVTTFNDAVTVSLKSGTGTSGADLSGTTTVQAVNGVATFSNLSLDTAGTGYVLNIATGPQLTVSTAAFDVAAPTLKPGDIDKSGTVDIADAALALRVAGGLVNGSAANVSVANGDLAPKGAPDGRITLLDAERILRAVKGLDTLP